MMRHLEELAANAWPGLQSAQVDGWVLRLAGGYSRRANSVLPLHTGSLPLGERIERCEALFHLAGLPPVFKLFPEAEPEGLDEALAALGYEKQAYTSVMTLDSLERPLPADPAGITVSVASVLLDPWFEAYAADHQGSGRNLAAARDIMGHILPPQRYVLLEDTAGPAACALAVVEDGWAGIFDVVVRQDLRGRGLGRYLMERTLAEAAQAGARRSYLQVMDQNEVAVNLYGRMGYRKSYPYWYRVKEARP